VAPGNVEISEMTPPNQEQFFWSIQLCDSEGLRGHIQNVRLFVLRLWRTVYLFVCYAFVCLFVCLAFVAIVVFARKANIQDPWPKYVAVG
jgi:hypothetical protein